MKKAVRRKKSVKKKTGKLSAAGTAGKKTGRGRKKTTGSGKKTGKAKLRKKAVRRKKAVPRKRTKPQKRVTVKKPAAKTKQEGRYIGKVTHYFAKVHAAVLKLESKLAVGDSIRIDSGGVSFKQKVKSLQINRIPIDEGRKGEEVGLEVKRDVKEGDSVYRV